MTRTHFHVDTFKGTRCIDSEGRFVTQFAAEEHLALKSREQDEWNREAEARTIELLSRLAFDGDEIECAIPHVGGVFAYRFAVRKCALSRVRCTVTD